MPSKLHHISIDVIVVGVGIRRGAVLILEHAIEAWEREVALGAFGLKTHPQLKALDVAQMLAERKLLQSITIFVVGETDETSDDTMVREGISVGDHAHLDEILRINSLLEHIVDTILSQCFNCVLVLLDRFLDICK